MYKTQRTKHNNVVLFSNFLSSTFPNFTTCELEAHVWAGYQENGSTPLLLEHLLEPLIYQGQSEHLCHLLNLINHTSAQLFFSKLRQTETRSDNKTLFFHLVVLST